MDFGQIISASWRIAWRERGLWVLALFAGSASGTCSGGGGGGSSLPSGGGEDAFSQAQIDELMSVVQQYLGQAIAVMIVVGIVFLIVYIPFWLLSIRCKGALIAAGAQAAGGAPVSLGSAWRDGGPAFGRLFKLELLLTAVGLVVLGLVVGFALASVAGQPLERVQWLPLVLGLFGVLALVGIVASVLGVIVAYAQRTIVLEGAGPIEGLKSGYRLLRANLGNSVILWLIALALGIGGGIALIIGLLVAAIPALIVGGIAAFVVNAVDGPGIGVLIGIVAVVLFVAVLAGGAALNSLLWHFWTVAYLRLTGVWPPVPEPPAASALEAV
jgi:hypothetical protein